MKKILISIVTILIVISISPILYFEFKKSGIEYFEFDKIISGDYNNISEKQLMGLDFELKKNKGSLLFSHDDSLVINKKLLLTRINFKFINGLESVENDWYLSKKKPQFYQLYNLFISYQFEFDSLIIKSINEIFSTKKRPNHLSIENIDDTLYVCKWQQEDKYELHYLRGLNSEKSIIRNRLKRSFINTVINYYVRSVYSKLPSFIQPKWYKKLL